MQLFNILNNNLLMIEGKYKILPVNSIKKERTMWAYLKDLPPVLSFSLILVGVIAVVIISMKGKLIAKWGKNAIGIGTSDDNKDNTKSYKGTGNGKTAGSTSTSIPIDTTIGSLPPPPGTVFVEKKRSCADCIEIILNKKDKYDFNKQIREDKILNYRMNYTEEKLIEIEKDLLDLFEKRIEKFSSTEYPNKIIEDKMFYGLLKEALYEVKKEIRKSYKEDLFCELSDVDFITFIKDKTKVIETILLRHLRNVYPSNGTLVHIDTIISDIENNNDNLHDYIKDIFTYAKQATADNEKEMQQMKKDFKEWTKRFIE
jgi:NTP pyrophosphatase (non-canonical NTP hydrolase)